MNAFSIYQKCLLLAYLGKLLETLDKNETTLQQARDQLSKKFSSRVRPTELVPPDSHSAPKPIRRSKAAAALVDDSMSAAPVGEANEEEPAEEEPPAVATSWNPSTKVPPTFWPRESELRDCYPRDPYTHMPYPESTPPALNVRAGDPAAVLQRENQSLNDPSLPSIQPEHPLGRARNRSSTEQKRKARADCYKGQAEER